MKIQSWTPRIYAPVLAVQLALLAVAPKRVLSVNYGLVLVVLAITLFLCWHRFRLAVRHNRPLWALLFMALVSQTAAFGLLFSDSLVNPQGTLVAFDPTFYFCLNSLLLTIAAAYNPIAPLYRLAGLLDSILACIIAALFYILLHRVIDHAATDTAAAVFIMWMFDAMSTFVALVSTLRFVSTKRADERRFYFVLMTFAWADVIFPAAHNRFILHSESYLPELLLSLPFVIVGVLLSRRRKVWFRGYRPSRRARMLAAGLNPFALSLALCLLAFGEIGTSPLLALCALVLAITSYAARAAIVLSRQLTSEEELRALQRNLQRAIVHDDLTRLLNRRGFYRKLDRAWEAAAVSGHPITVAMLDIDAFKLFNDTYGHLAGDECLAAVGAALAGEAAASPEVTVARYGGEEFAVLLQHANRADAERTLQRMRLRVEALAIAHVRSKQQIVTVSAGLASTLDAHYQDSGKLLDAADAALYEAKRAGRNGIRWHTADPRHHPHLAAPEQERTGEG
ncbi:MAG TPA: GGDEF domain-containing protein [Dyella sp.]|uniref:GGDEF domain-containing protein n=1 Tax=Dyella sp. TaxID=1869338 RepID=UPI002C221F85|nr:GGDEF domain-containing protein [Dyella sp.]HTV85438.1 GGDEF domain-containing protein [Dyella sp.]